MEPVSESPSEAVPYPGDGTSAPREHDAIPPGISEPRVPRVLTPGATGADVSGLQRMLLSLGYEVEVTGRMDGPTAAAVRAFQASEGLAQDGIAGEETAAALERRLVRHAVRPGETLWELAAFFGTTVPHVKRLNGMRSDILRVGQEILLPVAGMGDLEVADGYTVRTGETLSSIARRLGTPVAELARANHLLSPDRIRAGQRIRIPGDSQRLPGTTGFVLDRPVQGRISSPFGWRTDPFESGRREFHEGVDIAVPRGTPIRAAADGRVTTAGSTGAYGLAVVLDHGGDVETLYGHNDHLEVRPGIQVARGEVIAHSGSTGRSTGPHLDFRVRVAGRYVDPTQYWR
ncbi:peptidase M23B [Limnochorda pilosa]|uniref:Peptidase M23B n=1 Tax=Limnochorda pilosa TaxID=1555112 RepID=A0A0K2SQJ9_LIMPI|nr:peptidase M23B [Limnochorda pilosa]